MNSGKYTVDRIEGNQLVLLFRDDESAQLLLKNDEISEEVHEGDIVFLEFDTSGKLIFSEVLKEETAQARKKAQDLLNKLKNR